MRRKSAGPDGRLQRADMNAELFGQFAERQQLSLLSVMFDRRPSPPQPSRRHGVHPAVTPAKGVQGYVEQSGKVALREVRVATQLAKLVHAEHTMPSAAPVVKRPPAFQAGAHHDRFLIGSMQRTMSDAELLRKLNDHEIRKLWNELARLIALFDGCSPAHFLRGEIGEFFRKGRA